MVGNDNAAGNLSTLTSLMPVKAKWFNDGAQELLLEINEAGEPVIEEHKSWVKGKLSNKHPRTNQIKREQREQESK
jgi:hypothetical protein